MSFDEETQKLQLERLKKENEQIDVEIAYRKIELALLEKALAN